MTKKTNIIFMGTPEFSVPALKRLAGRDDFHISLVVTQPDRPKGRGKKLVFSPVKQAALKLNLDIYQPERLNAPEGLERLSALNPDYYVVAAFGQILSQKILDIPKIYPINIHGSLLPRYRGASPIQAAVMNMDKESGITTMVMAKDMDAGDVLLMSKTTLNPVDTAQDLHDRLAVMGGDLILETIDQINGGILTPSAQDHSRATYVSMLKKEDGKIDWTKTAMEIRAHVNAMTPWPGAFTYLDDNRLKIFKVLPDGFDTDKKPGTVLHCDKKGIHVAAGSGSIIIEELMGFSGKRLQADAFLRGYPLEPGARLDS